jgi:hypothetical protein
VQAIRFWHDARLVCEQAREANIDLFDYMARLPADDTHDTVNDDDASYDHQSLLPTIHE